MPIVGFTQDPAGPPGMGMFHDDAGGSIYAHAPDMAAPFLQPEQPSQAIVDAAAPGPDMRLAGPGGGPVDAGPMSDPMDGGFSPAAPKMSPAAAPAPPSVQAEQVPAAAVAPAPQAAPIGQPSPALDEAQAHQQAVLDYVNRPTAGVKTKAGFTPKSKSESYEEAGPEYTQEDAEARADANIAVRSAMQNKAQAEADRYAGQSMAYQAAMPKLQEQAAKAQKDYDDQRAQYRQERAELQKIIQENNATEKGYNPNRWFETRGAVGQVAAGLAQAFGAYAATLSGGDNWVQKQINGFIDADIAKQKAQIEAGKAHANNALQQLNLRYGDMGQAESALKIAMQHQVETQAAQMVAGNQSQDVQNAFAVWQAQNQKDRVAEEQKFYAASLGKRKGTVEMQYHAAGGGAPTEKQKQERIATLKGLNDVNQGAYETELKRQEATTGMAPKDARKEVIEYGKEREKLDSADIAMDRTMKELQSLREKYGGTLPGRGAPGTNFGTIAHSAGARLGVERSKDALRANQLVNQVKNVGAQANKGPASDQDIARIMEGIEGAGTSEELFNGLQSMRDLTRDSIQSLGGAYGEGTVARYEQQRRGIQKRDAKKEGTIR